VTHAINTNIFIISFLSNRNTNPFCTQLKPSLEVKAVFKSLWRHTHEFVPIRYGMPLDKIACLQLLYKVVLGVIM